MNRDFYRQLSSEPQSVFDDEVVLVWVDWREEEDAIVESVASKLDGGNLVATIDDADNEHGYAVSISSNSQPLTVDPSTGFDYGSILIAGIADNRATDLEPLQLLRTTFRCRDVVKKRIARLRWETWDRSKRRPPRVPFWGEPEGYILRRFHSRRAADEMGDLRIGSRTRCGNKVGFLTGRNT